jgi:hypothetical protein
LAVPALNYLISMESLDLFTPEQLQTIAPLLAGRLECDDALIASEVARAIEAASPIAAADAVEG